MLYILETGDYDVLTMDCVCVCVCSLSVHLHIRVLCEILAHAAPFRLNVCWGRRAVQEVSLLLHALPMHNMGAHQDTAG